MHLNAGSRLLDWTEGQGRTGVRHRCRRRAGLRDPDPVSDGRLPQPAAVDQIVPAAPVVTVIILSALNAYRSGVRFIGEQDYINIALGVGLGYAAALLLVAMGLAFEFAGFSPGFFILGPVLTSAALISVRFGGKRSSGFDRWGRDLRPAGVLAGPVRHCAGGAGLQRAATADSLLAPEESHAAARAGAQCLWLRARAGAAAPASEPGNLRGRGF